MFVSGDFGDKSPSWFLKKLKLPSFYSGNFKIFKNALEQFIPNRPPKHVITSTNCMTYNDVWNTSKLKLFLKSEISWSPWYLKVWITRTISCYWFLSIPPENQEFSDTNGMEWVKIAPNNHFARWRVRKTPICTAESYELVFHASSCLHKLAVNTILCLHLDVCALVWMFKPFNSLNIKVASI